MDFKADFYRESDCRFWQDELEDFVPAKVFDAHAHIWSEDHALADTPESLLRIPIDADMLMAYSRKLFPGRKLAFMMLGSPINNIDFDAHRRWCVSEAKKYPDCFCGVLTTPQMTPEEIIESHKALNYRALKPYLLYAPDTYNSSINGFITEEQIEAADQLGLMIVLHVSKAECFDDPENLQQLTYFTQKYPRVVWQLAHCARSFNGVLLEKCIHKLKHLDHICYDLSAVCDPYSMYLLFKHESIDRIMYGTDNVPCGILRGCYAPVNRTWELVAESARNQATFICYEQLRAMRRGAIMADLTEPELENIFYNNALRIYRNAPDI